jgi:hypothetical protein
VFVIHSKDFHKQKNRIPETLKYSKLRRQMLLFGKEMKLKAKREKAKFWQV